MIVTIIIIAIIVVIITVAAILNRRGNNLSFPWLQFYLNGRESGFRFSEITNLQRVVTQAELRDPLSVYWSRKSLVKCITTMNANLIKAGTLEKSNEARFLRKILNLLNKIHATSQRRKLGIRNSRDITVGTTLKMKILKNTYTSRVVENHHRYLAIVHPRLTENQASLSKFPGVIPVVVNFWRKNDSGYSFKSKIIGNYEKEQYPVIHLQHSGKLVRTVSRELPRKVINAPGFLTAYVDYDALHDAQRNSKPGLRCHIVDISEKGLSVVIGGNGSTKSFFHVVTNYQGVDLEYTGKLRGWQYDKNRNVSLLRLESTGQSLTMHNRISLIVYEIDTPDVGPGDSKSAATSDGRLELASAE